MNSETYRQAVIDANCLERGNFTLHSGAPSSLKINCDKLWLPRAENELEIVVHGLVKMVHDAKIEFDTVMGVPSGANKWALAIGEKCMRAVIRMEKKGGLAVYSSNHDRELAAAAQNVLVVEDVVTTRRSALAAIAQDEFIGKNNVAGLVSIWDRGNQAVHLPFPGICASLVNEELFDDLA